MIDANKCQVCFPIVAKVFEVKFEGEKEIRKCVLRGWRECDQPAVEHLTDYVDPTRPGTMFVLHRCAVHVEEARVLHETILKAQEQK